MGSEPPIRAEVGRPELVNTGTADRRGAGGSSLTRLTAAAVVVAGSLLLFGLLMTAGQEGPPSTSQPPRPDRTSEVGRGSIPSSRVVARTDGPVLGVPIGATAVSTDFDGRITTLALDSGVVTRTSIRTGAFVKVDDQLVVQTGCGAWQIVEIPGYTLGDHLIGCGSYQPINQRGSDVVFFGARNRDGVREVVMADGDGGVVQATPEVTPAAYGTASRGQMLIQSTDSELVWFQTSSGDSRHYANGTLIEAGPGGVLWSDCGAAPSCDVWFGTPEQARVSRFAVESSDGEYFARINDSGTRAVFFLEEEILRVVTIETGHAREVENPGIDWSTATWSPDGLWLLDPMGRDVVAFNTLNGRTVRFDGVPGDVSPGWVAVMEDPDS